LVSSSYLASSSSSSSSCCRCKYCFFTARHSAATLATHVEAMHRGGRDAKFQIVTDDSRFTMDMFTLSEDRSSYSCQLCCEAGRTGIRIEVPSWDKGQRSVKEHFQRRHTDTRFQCLACEDLFTSMADVNEHIKVAHTSTGPGAGEGEQEAPCEICGKFFKSSIALNLHNKTQHSEPAS